MPAGCIPSSCLVAESQSLPSSSRQQMEGYCPSVLLSHSLAFRISSKAQGIRLETEASSSFISDLEGPPCRSSLERRKCRTRNVATRSRSRSLPFTPRDRMPFFSRKLIKIFMSRFNINPSSGVSFQKPSSVCRLKSSAQGTGRLQLCPQALPSSSFCA